MLSKCLFHLRSDWIVTPRYFVEDSVWRVCWWTLIPNLTSVNSKWSNVERPDTPAIDSITPALSRTCLQNSNGHNYIVQ
jgi:hypothetical protein